MSLQVRYDGLPDMVMTLPSKFREIVYRTAGRAQVRAAVHDVYHAVQESITQHRPRCDASGRCCKFDEYGHELFVTTAEVATFVYELEMGAQSPQFPSGARSSDSCRFQTGKLCSVHAIRPFGCRMFFCDPAATAWQQEQYERFHARLKLLHQELEVPYAYLEWRRALEAIEL